MNKPWQPLLNNIAQLWDIQPNSIQLIRDVMNRVYRGITKQGLPIIIRLVQEERRSLADIQEEIALLMYLREYSNEYCRLYPNQFGQLVATFTQQEITYHVSCFYQQEGNGEIANDSALWDQLLFIDIGRLIGRLHRLTADFELKHSIKRHHYSQEEAFNDLRHYTTGVPDKVISAIEQLLAKIGVQATNTGYGLVHGDIKQDNFFYTSQNNLFLYDFDHCCQCWKIYDLVVPLYFNYSYPLCRISTATDNSALHFLRALVEGYQKEHHLDRWQLALIPDLLALREALLYLIVKKIEHKIDVANNKSMKQEFNAAYQIMEDRLINQIPHFEFDFTKIY
jgi:Ser/Thr protein kinase RdoA (MazF antagonist)